MTDHRHLIYGRVNNALQVGWCECGATYSIPKEKWGPPKYTEGTIRAAQWRPEASDAQ